MADATLNFGDGSASADATFGTAVPHTFSAGQFGVSAMTPTGARGHTNVTGPGDFDIVVTDENAPPPVEIPATTAVAGTPGTFLPVGAVTPADGVAIEALTAQPLTLWIEGQSVVAANSDARYWDSAAWQPGAAPAAVEE